MLELDGYLTEGALHFLSNAAARGKSFNNVNDAAVMCLVCSYFSNCTVSTNIRQANTGLPYDSGKTMLSGMLVTEALLIS